MTATAQIPQSRGIKSAISGPLLFLLIWECAARLLSGSFVLAGPIAIADYLIDNTALMARALAETLKNAALGFLIGNMVAIALAVLAIVVPRTEMMVRGLALLVFCIPLVASGPILRVVYGPGPGPQITLAALAVYYTTLIPLLVGLRAVPSAWLDLVKSYGRGRLAAFAHVRARAALPYLVAGLQIAAPAAFLGAMVGEFTGAERGMGVLTIRAMRSMDVDMTWALAVVATTVAVLAYVAIGKSAKRFMRQEPPVILAVPPMTIKGRQRSAFTNVLTLTALALFLWWGGIHLLGLNPFFAKGPDDVLHALAVAPDAAMTRSTLMQALGETMAFLIPGYVVGLASGAGLAILLTLMPSIASASMPVAIALRSVPIITTAPLVVLLLGRGAVGTITLVAIMVFFPTFVACLYGLKQAPGRVLDVFDSFAASPLKKLFHVRIPTMVPAFFAAARMNVPASVLAVTVVEWLATGNGIGSLMALSASTSDYDMLWSCVAVVALLSSLGYAVVGSLEKAVFRVYAPEQLV